LIVTFGGVISPATTSQISHTFRIGASQGLSLFYDGSMDEIMVFNTSLTATQILDLYNNQSSRFKSQGSQTFKQFNITHSTGNNTVNVTVTDYQRNFQSNLSIRLGQWDISRGYNDTIDGDGNDVAINDSVVLWYHFDNQSDMGENDTHVFDWSGNNNNGTAINGFLANTSQAIWNGSFRFDGINDIVDAGNSASLRPTISITYSVWFKTDLLSGARVLVSNRATSGDFSGAIMFVDTTDKLDFRVTTDGTSWTVALTGDDELVTDRWYHAVGTFTSGDSALYIDGVKQTETSTQTGTINYDGDNLRVGADSNALRFNGSIDEVIVFNRSLNSTEVKELYVRGRANYNFSVYQNLSRTDSNDNKSMNNFSISINTTNILPEFLFTAGNSTSNPFYSPLLIPNINFSFEFVVGGDITPPNVTINQPLNQTYATTTIDFNVTAVDETEMSDVYYTLNGGVDNFSMSNLSTSPAEWNATNTTMAQGSHTVIYYANDTNDNLNWTENVTFLVDTIDPAILIEFPSNNTNTTDNNIDVNFSVSDINLDTCWWSNDSFTINHTITCGQNITTITWVEGIHNVTVWANDSANNENHTSVSFTIDLINPNISIVIPLNNNTNTTIIQDINFTRSDTNLDSCWYSNDTFTVNITLASCGNLTTIVWSEQQHNVTIYVNDTFGNENHSSISFIVKSYGTIDVNISFPPDNFGVIQSSTFEINGTITCRGTNAICGDILGLARYNISETPDTAINRTPLDKPFFTIAINLSNGFDVKPSSGLPAGITFDPTDNSFWIIDFSDNFVTHFNSSGDNQTDGFETLSAGGNLLNTITFDTRDNSFWLVGDSDEFVYHFDSSGVNQTDGFNITEHGSDFATGIAFDPTDNSFWVVDNTDDFIYHFDSDGNNLTDGFDVSQAGSDEPFGIAFDPTDNSFWIVNRALGDDDFVYHFNSSGDNQTDGFDIFAAGIGSSRGITFDTRDNSLWVTDVVDDFIYHFSGHMNPKISHKNLEEGESFNVTWIINASGIEGTKYELDIFFNSSYRNSNVLDNQTLNITICIGSCPEIIIVGDRKSLKAFRLDICDLDNNIPVVDQHLSLPKEWRINLGGDISCYYINTFKKLIKFEKENNIFFIAGVRLWWLILILLTIISILVVNISMSIIKK